MNLQTMSKQELAELIAHSFAGEDEALFAQARAVREQHFGRKVFIRGLIEISNFCRNDCYYCGIRASNHKARRYRLRQDEILSCCETGYALGFRTFVLQGGEDAYFTDGRLCDVVGEIHRRFPDAAITLSLGERSEDSYKRLFEAGAARYLLRHETANDCHYGKLHPMSLSLENRKRCLYQLKQIGFQTGAGFMVGSPCQTAETLAEDLIFLRELQPQMVGIGPFIPHQDTPFANEPSGGVHQTLVMVALTRLLLPNVLLPATTALGSILDGGREKGLAVGANVVMPNLSPAEHRADYSLYDGKLSQGAEAVEGLAILKGRLAHAGFEIDMSRGDYTEK